MGGEDSPLLPVARCSGRKQPKCGTRWCVKSKAACLVLLWNLSVLLAYKGFYDINAALQVATSSWGPILANAVLTLVAIFAPVAGLLTDIRFSRHRAILCTSYAILAKFALLVAAILVLYFTKDTNPNTALRRYILYSVMIIISTIYIVFLINAIQFGMDQLHDSPTDDLIMFIHWYVWIYHTCSLNAEVIWNLLSYDPAKISHFSMTQLVGIAVIVVTVVSIVVLKILSMCVLRWRKNWFLLEKTGLNPYKLVYRVSKFAYHHKVPLRRSAFTYNAEESFSRMDTAKLKYGGPFTTKEVEDVKAVWGILRVLLSAGPAFLLQAVIQSMLPLFAKHGKFLLSNYTIGNNTHTRIFHTEDMARYMIISNGLLNPLLVVICIPLYLCWIRPRIAHYMPGMMKRIQIAIFLTLLSLLSTFAMDLVIHIRDSVGDVNCMFNGFNKDNTNNEATISPNDPLGTALYQDLFFLTCQHILSALVNMLMDIAVLEFICSQSPYSMKGLLLGLSFSIKSLFQGVAITSILLFASWQIHPLSCGSAFYIINITLALMEFILFRCVARRYKYRDDNEPSYEYIYAENYYSNIQ